MDNENEVQEVQPENEDNPADLFSALGGLMGQSSDNTEAEPPQTGMFKNLFESLSNAMFVKVKYMGSPQLQYSEAGGCIDLYTAEEVTLKAGESTLIPLGVAMELPEKYDALLLPRSSTFSKWGILLANSVGYIDNAYNGDTDEWKANVYATRDVTIPAQTRCFQFRVIERQPRLNFLTAATLGNEDRGGFGSTDE